MANCLIIRKGTQIEGTATPSQVLKGKTFQSENSDDLQTGTMINYGAYEQYVAQGYKCPIPEGYHNGKGVITAVANTGNASESQVLSGATFYSDSYLKKTGTMTNQGAVSTSVSAGSSYTIPSGYHNGSGTVTNPCTNNFTIISNQGTVPVVNGATYAVMVCGVFDSNYTSSISMSYSGGTVSNITRKNTTVWSRNGANVWKEVFDMVATSTAFKVTCNQTTYCPNLIVALMRKS